MLLAITQPRADVVRAALEEAGIDPDDHDELSVSGTDGRWSWEVLPRSRVDDRTYAAAITEAIATRQRWRHEDDTAKTARSGPAPPDTASAARVRQLGNTRRRQVMDHGMTDERLLLRPGEAAERLGIGGRRCTS